MPTPIPAEVLAHAMIAGRPFETPEEVDASIKEIVGSTPYVEIGYRKAAYRTLMATVADLTIQLAQSSGRVTIDGTSYRVNEDHRDDHRVTIQRWPAEGDAYAIDGRWGDDALTPDSPNAGFTCDCPDFRYRHSATGSAGCKHIRTVAAFGMLPALAERPESDPEGERDDDASDYARDESVALAGRYNGR